MITEHYPNFTNSVIIKNILKQLIDILKDEEIADKVDLFKVIRDPSNLIVRIDMITLNNIPNTYEENISYKNQIEVD